MVHFTGILIGLRLTPGHHFLEALECGDHLCHLSLPPWDEDEEEEDQWVVGGLLSIIPQSGPNYDVNTSVRILWRQR